MQPAEILKSYPVDIDDIKIIPFGNGLINHTWKIETSDPDKSFILQRINSTVFKKPEDIASNIRHIAIHLKKHHPCYLFIAPVLTLAGEEMHIDKNQGYFRVFPFQQNAISYDVVSTSCQAYEAARQFALFTKQLSELDAASLHITLPDFHNLALRFRQFEQALKNGNQERINNSADLAAFLLDQKYIVDEFESIRKNPGFRIRVMHHDTKISNVLFDENSNGLCVIDLDTVMPGYFISDVGDMMRTYLSPVSEEETNLCKVCIREDYFRGIVEGYLSEMGDLLTEAEKSGFVFAGKFMIYMQALRFYTDYLNNDVYYGERYEGHNLQRARNQAFLLQQLTEKEWVLDHIVSDCLLQSAIK